MALANFSSGYGTDEVGLICGYQFCSGKPGIDIHSAAAEGLKTGTAEGFIWLHFNLSHAACEKWLKDQLQLPADFFEALHDGTRSTRIEHVDEALIAVINDVIFDFSFDPSDLATLWIYAGPRLLVTSRVRPLRSIDRLREAVRASEIFRSPIELMVHLLRDQADVLAQITREVSQRVDLIEDGLLKQRIETNRSGLGSLRRLLIRLQRLLAPEAGAMFRLLNRPPHWLTENDAQDLRESSEEITLVVGDLGALLERIKLLQEELAAILNERMNNSVFMLTLVTVLALPINIRAGLMGMNVGGIPLANNPHGFWLLTAAVITLTSLIGIWVFRNNRN